MGGFSVITTKEEEIMAKHGKKYQEAAKLIDREATYKSGSDRACEEGGHGKI